MRRLAYLTLLGLIWSIAFAALVDGIDLASAAVAAELPDRMVDRWCPVDRSDAPARYYFFFRV
jgi:hypothetical protein